MYLHNERTQQMAVSRVFGLQIIGVASYRALETAGPYSDGEGYGS